MKKICVVVTARPSYSRIKTALAAIKNHPNLKLQLVVSGSALLNKYGNALEIIENDGFEIKDKVYTVLDGENPTSMAKTTGLAVLELSNSFDKLQPDGVITIADRFETLATSIAASYQNIPLIHIQGGEVTGNIDEKVRHANTKLADIHFVSSEESKERVLKMGENPKKVFNTGCPSIDLAHDILNTTSLDFNPIEKYGGVGNDINWREGYIVVMQHPVTTEYSSSRKDIEETLKAVYELGLPTFWFWPNVDAGSDGTSGGIRAFREKHAPENIHFFKNMEPHDFLKLLRHSECLIGNSSVGIRECSYLAVPTVNIGSRQNSRQRGLNVKDVNYSSDEIKDAIKTQISKKSSLQSENIYGEGDSGERIANLISEIDLTYDKTIVY